MRLGPVEHRQPGLPPALNIENYHQFNKVWPNEVENNQNQNPSTAFHVAQLRGYLDPVPHRHKYDQKEMAELRKKVGGANKNAPLYSLHQTLQAGEEARRFTYVESRYFYCKAYERLAKETADFGQLREKMRQGTNLMICGYDACPITRPLYEHYCDATHPFGHELVLYALLTVADPLDYPWNQYRVAHPDIYENIAYCL